MKTYFKSSGFSLVELIVAIGIICILSAAVFIRMGGTSDRIATRESAGVIRDTIQRAELQILRGEDDLSQIALHFLPDYLIQEESYENSPLIMDIKEDCPPGQTGVVLENSGTLYKSTDGGESFDAEFINASPSNPSPPICFDFATSNDKEWIYRLENEGKKRTIRFIHFNIMRNENSPHVSISNLTGDTVLFVKSPGVKKELYVDGTRITGAFNLTLKNEDGSADETLDFEF